MTKTDWKYCYRYNRKDNRRNKLGDIRLPAHLCKQALKLRLSRASYYWLYLKPY